MRKLLGVCLFALLLTGPAFAGEMQNGSPTPPPPPLDPATTAQELTVIATVEDGAQGSFQDTVTKTALELLAVLPSLL